MITILWGRTTDLANELNPSNELAAWAKYRELATTRYAALIIDTETVTHNLETGPVVGRTQEGEMK